MAYIIGGVVAYVATLPIVLAILRAASTSETDERYWS